MRVDQEIRTKEVRLIDAENRQIGVVLREDALEKARAAGLNLIEIVPNAAPPVCKIMDYGKYLFKQNKKQAEAKKKQKRVQIKRLRLRPTIDEGDYQVKVRNLRRFLEEGDKVEVSLRFRGREVSHRELGVNVLKRIQEDLADCAEVEHKPSLQERQMMMVLTPKKKK